MSEQRRITRLPKWAQVYIMGVYGAWLFKGRWDGHTPPPPEGWKLLRMVPGHFQHVPPGLEPKRGQVTLLGRGDKVIVVMPE